MTICSKCTYDLCFDAPSLQLVPMLDDIPLVPFREGLFHEHSENVRESKIIQEFNEFDMKSFVQNSFILKMSIFSGGKQISNIFRHSKVE